MEKFPNCCDTKARKTSSPSLILQANKSPSCNIKGFRKSSLKRLLPVIYERNLIPNHQFGFQRQHSTVEQVHRVANLIKQDLEKKQYCTAAFLDISQAFDKVWHKGLLYKIKKMLPHSFYNILRSYVSNRFFQIKLKDALSGFHTVESGVPQGSVLGPVLYVLYTADLPISDGTNTATFADDTAILVSHHNAGTATAILQRSLNCVSEWLKMWRIKVNEGKSAHITFTLKTDTCPPVYLNNVVLPQVTEVKYLGMHLDRRLTWKTHIWNKRLNLNLKYRQLSWILNKHSKLSTENKILLYKVILKPIWTYGIQLWGTTSNSNINIIQRFQSKVIRAVLQAPWYVSNLTLHKDTCIPFVVEEIERYTEKYLSKLDNHPNHLAVNLLDNSDHVYRLKRHSVLDLTSRFKT